MSGVSVAAILHANEIKAGRVLIVCRARDRFRWLEAWREHTRMPYYVPGGRWGNLVLYPVQSAAHGVPDVRQFAAAVITVSPQLLRSPGIRAALRGMPFDLVIVSTGAEPRLGTWAELIEPSRGSDRLTGTPFAGDAPLSVTASAFKEPAP